jgi:hypothetical protein
MIYSNYNGFHPGFSGGGGARPRTTRFAGGDEPRLGRGSGPAFRAQDTRQLILVGNETCPVISPCGGTTPCSRSVSGVSATHGTRVAASEVSEFDFVRNRAGSPSSVNRSTCDPEAALCTRASGCQRQ